MMDADPLVEAAARAIGRAPDAKSWVALDANADQLMAEAGMVKIRAGSMWPADVRTACADHFEADPRDVDVITVNEYGEDPGKVEHGARITVKTGKRPEHWFVHKAENKQLWLLPERGPVRPRPKPRPAAKRTGYAASMMNSPIWY